MEALSLYIKVIRLRSRKQYVRRGLTKSSVTYLVCRVPQGSILGSSRFKSFVLYTGDLTSDIDSSGLSPHMYANDTQVYGSCQLTDVDIFTSKVSECIETSTRWMRSNRLQPDPGKSEVLWCATGWCRHQLPISPPLINGCLVSPVLSVPGVGIYVDHDLLMQMQMHMTKTDISIHCDDTPFSQICCSVPVAVLQILVVTLVHFRLDCGNLVLVRIPVYLQQ